MAKKLRIKKLNKAGRSRGKITTRHRGGGHKRLYRIIDFKRNRLDRPVVVLSIEYDPNRSANIVLVEYKDTKERIYFLAPAGIKPGDTMVTSDSPANAIGNRGPLKNLPIGTSLYNVSGSVRSAGSAAILQSIDSGYAQLKLPSGEIKLFPEDKLGSIGQVSNPGHGNMKLYKAGQRRWRGFRPTVRGSAMSAGDHPHGGGEGRQGIGLKHPKTPWGKPALGKKTRKKKKWSNKLIIKPRKKKKRR